MANQILLIQPYRHAGTWVFDDPDKDLDKEPFVQGIPEMIDHLGREIPDAASGFRLLFSADPFPGFQLRAVFVREEMGGAWYRVEELDAEGWLCPALFRYFDRTPRRLHAKAEPLR